MEKPQFKLEIFEGPLDLMLSLISKHKLNIYDIEINALVLQYLDYIGRMNSLDLEVSSEFLEMAARLVYIKSAMLLPKHEEADELREELRGQLIEYGLIKAVSARLKELYTDEIFVRAPAGIQFDLIYERIHPPEVILDAMLAAAGRGGAKLPPPDSAFNGIVKREVVPVESKISHILAALSDLRSVEVKRFFCEGDGKSGLIATFLAILELIRAGRIFVSESDILYIRTDF
ncbi:MAG: segregation/condensation protein A [Oscillospiraceae bacterium]|jgi:segregation and condensation protein A|nr:segregation/condensation protein A [Oscillospiraceae bacterium]